MFGSEKIEKISTLHIVIILIKSVPNNEKNHYYYKITTTLCYKKPLHIWDVNVDTIIISKLVKTKTNSKYFTGIKFDKVIISLVLMVPKMSGYVKTFKDKDKNSKLMSFRLDDEKLLEGYKAIWTNIEDF